MGCLIKEFIVTIQKEGETTDINIVETTETNSIYNMNGQRLERITEPGIYIVNGKKITKKSRVEATVLNSLTPISKSEICKILPDVSPTTVEAVLGQMVKSGSIKKIGDGRNSRYLKIN